MNLSRLLSDGLERLAEWRAGWDSASPDRIMPNRIVPDRAIEVPEERVRQVLEELVDRLRDNYPFWHPSYAGQMIKPPHDVATLAYFLTQQINPNNHALDGGPATATMEKEVIAELALLFGFETHLGHLTSSGTIANLEALWVARELAPGKAIAFSRQAHYTHQRMCGVLGVSAVEIATDAGGRMDPEDLRRLLRAGNIGTVVVTAGTTGVGAVDPIEEVLGLREEFPFRLHVDAAYGGFFRLLAGEPGLLEPRDAASFEAIRHCDSVVVDPHKHGLQPYGCGSVIFRDPEVGRLYKHDSPYTYFTSQELHLGEISLECSRPGAAAAALWATLQCFPLDGAEKGLGAVLKRTRGAALAWATLIAESPQLELLLPPSLDIINFYPRPNRINGTNRTNAAGTHGIIESSLPDKASAISALSESVFRELMEDPDHPVYLACFKAPSSLFARRSEIEWDAPPGAPGAPGVPGVTVLRSVLLKPEHADYVPTLHRRVLETLARRIQ